MPMQSLRPCPACREGSFYSVADWRDGYNGGKVWIDPQTGNRHECDRLESVYAAFRAKGDPLPLPPGQAERDSRRVQVLADQLTLSASTAVARFAEQQKKAREDFERAHKDREAAFVLRQSVAKQDHARKLSDLRARITAENQARIDKRTQTLAELEASTQAAIDELVDYEFELAEKRAKIRPL